MISKGYQTNFIRMQFFASKLTWGWNPFCSGNSYKVRVLLGKNMWPIFSLQTKSIFCRRLTSHGFYFIFANKGFFYSASVLMYLNLQNTMYKKVYHINNRRLLTNVINPLLRNDLKSMWYISGKWIPLQKNYNLQQRKAGY